jgi:hypothetical protein
MKPDIHGVRTHWIRGFMAFQLVRFIPSVMLMVLAWPESGFEEGAVRLRPLEKAPPRLRPLDQRHCP